MFACVSLLTAEEGMANAQWDQWRHMFRNTRAHASMCRGRYTHTQTGRGHGPILMIGKMEFVGAPEMVGCTLEIAGWALNGKIFCSKTNTKIFYDTKILTEASMNEKWGRGFRSRSRG